ncbi:unnamed protein product [Gongylonema pulchrum]|uniref:non-specific serine/threonine protein kinase n=1 Tax=Gongylonema pulchrum TaxID=637853 RepID=A0A183E884_9BILA|nr:unnamed protein product [Gongylonema pulchrum]
MKAIASPAAKANVSRTQESKKSSKKSEKEELLKVGEMLRGRYTVESKLGRGAFGHIYRAYDRLKLQSVAVKVGTPRMDTRRMKIEQIVLTLLRGKSHFPILIGTGKIRGLPYLVMELVGRNLSELRKSQPQKCFQPITVYRISMQVMSALHDLHRSGFLHRDIKPSNFCIGRGLNRRKIYLLDHGMARMFMNMDGTFRAARNYAGFRGSLRYVSLTVHARQESGPCDDLIGWLYSMIEMINGKLPWSKLTRPYDIEQAKMSETPESLCKDQPNTSLEFATVRIFFFRKLFRQW